MLNERETKPQLEIVKGDINEFEIFRIAAI